MTSSSHPAVHLKVKRTILFDAVGNLGKCHLWQLAVKPGRPMSFGQINNTLIFHTSRKILLQLFVCFLLYVRPSIETLGGGIWKEPQRYKVSGRLFLLNQNLIGGNFCVDQS